MILKRETFDKILKRSGAQRVSPKASEYFASFMEELAIKLLKEALEYSKHAKRNTVLLEDVILARKKLGI